MLVASYEVLEAVTGFHVHRGILASFGRLPERTPEQVLAGARRVVVLEAMNNHTNLGAVFRSAAGLGMDAVLLDRRCADPLYRRSVRVSMGEVFSVPWAFLDDWPGALGDLVARGFRVLAMTPAPDAVPLSDVRLADDDRAALLLGAEGPGPHRRGVGREHRAGADPDVARGRLAQRGGGGGHRLLGRRAAVARAPR